MGFNGSNMLRALDATAALARLIRNPDETELAFRVVEAIDGPRLDRLVARFTASAGGASLLAERPSLLSAVSDTRALAAMPADSLGRAYLEFCEREGITPGGLVEASDPRRRDELDPETRYVADRLRDSHDLWHVLAGYRTDLLGELCVLAFSAAQVGSRGVAVLLAAGYVQSYRFPRALGARGRALVREAWLRGRRASWLPAAHLEAMLERPLGAVRHELGLGEAPAYAPVYPDALAA